MWDRAPPQGFKTRLVGEGFQTLIKGNLFSSPTNVKLREGFHTLIKGDLFSSPTNVGGHNPPPFGAQRPRWHSFLYPIDVGRPPKSTPLGPSVLIGPPPRVYPPSPLRGTARRPAHRPVTGSDTICNDQDPLLADIVLFGLSLSGFPSKL